MKIAHRQTMWQHSLFSLLMAGALLLLSLAHGLSVLGLALLCLVYAGGNIFIHLLRHDLARHTVYEYILVGTAVFLVVGSLIGR